MEKLTIIIVSFNTKDYLKKCLESIFRVKEPVGKSHGKQKSKRVNVEIIVLDNASSDGSVEQISSFAKATEDRKNFKLKFILNRGNLGFARANNQGIRVAEGEYVLLLNSDTEVKAGALERLIEFAENHPQAGVVGPRLLNSDGSIQPSVFHQPTLWRAIRQYWLGEKGAYEKYVVTGSNPVKVEAVVGAAMLISSKVLDKVGFLDERYFMYFEDLDYCRRVRLAGLEIYYLPTAEVVHHHGASGKGLSKTYQYLVESSKIYHGVIKYWILTAILWLGQKWQKILKKME